ncbi:galactose oxidase [Lophiostoma macrostomum CBS 122681]|uniref:Galactose oxidase n=1 Tax=Lophiostoma macrostomum CBS 122681 TaxID=1314788 RepID=A0A6A6T4Q3_9PLEO|nr:galactose oxidase [Lophiostoma macrostomum CBS 122681]
MLPLGVVAYPSVIGSTTPLSDESWTLWRRPKASALKRVWSNRKRRSRESASTLSHLQGRRYARPLAAQPQDPRLHSSLPSSPSRPKHVPIVIPRYVPIVAPESPCNSVAFSSSRTSTVVSSERPSLSNFPLPGRKSSVDSSSLRPRHVEIVIPSDWTSPGHPNSTSPAISHPAFPHTNAPTSLLQKQGPASMARQTPNTSRANTMDSQTSAPSPSQLYTDTFRNGNGAYVSSMNSSQTSLHRQEGQDAPGDRPPASRTPGSGVAASPALMQTAGLATSSSSTAGLSGLVCNVHRTTGREPHPLVGATTTILGDRLYVFGGRKLSRTRPQLTSDLYELDLVKRHWTKIEAKGDIPPPRYFHSVCGLGDTKLVCYGGMSPATQQLAQGASLVQANTADAQPEVVVMSDVHIYDVPTRTWMHVATPDAPQGRYAHCATILPSSATFASANAPLAAIRHNPSSSVPNQGSIGLRLDGEGGAEMVVVGGQDSANHYIEQISVFNLRSLKWTATNTLGRSCGAYRSVVAPLARIDPTKIGTGTANGSDDKNEEDPNVLSKDDGASMLIYSNYNFLDVKLELQVRHPDGSLSEKPMHGNFSPPGLRFPNGGVINNHFVVSGTFLTSSKQEYALWALDLRTLSWGRIEAGGNIFSQGSWNRGVLWNRRNAFVILGNRKRSLVEDYNHRRINFSNICVVELEAFGLYDNPRKVSPNSAFVSTSAPRHTERLDSQAGGRNLSTAALDLGRIALGMRELADMDFLAIHGERIPVNSHLIARRWGPYFNHLLAECATSHETSDAATLRPSGISHPQRNSSITITPSIKTNYSAATTLTNNTVTPSESTAVSGTSQSSLDPPDPSSHLPHRRPRTLFLPHTHLTLQALIHFLYTSSLPPQDSKLCSPQILCSLLQLARPYHIDGLLEAIIERLHVLLDNRNTAAIFNAAAMAAGGGSGVAFLGVNGIAPNGTSHALPDSSTSTSATGNDVAERSLDPALRALRINTDVNPSGVDDEVSSATSTSTSASVSDSGFGDGSGIGTEREIWGGEISAVVGLQKRGLRGLMEGRRIREMGRGSSRSRDEGAGINGHDGVGLGLMSGA